MIDKLAQQISFGGNQGTLAGGLATVTTMIAPTAIGIAQGLTLASVWSATIAAVAAAAPFVIVGGAIAGTACFVAKLVEDDTDKKKEE